MTNWMNLLCWYIFMINVMRSCNQGTTLHCVESYLYYIILVYKNIFGRVKRGRKQNRQYIYIVENIEFIYTSFDKFFIPVSQRVEMNYIFSVNERILYLSFYFKSPKKLSNCLKRAETRVVLIVFDCVLCEVRSYKLISL
jgi:hypothetical protein